MATTYISSNSNHSNAESLKQSPYVGRFAPSPTGKLHFGSLVGALASFLDARANQGQWLVRIEDIDPPREITGAADAIIKSLDHHQLHWDKTILYQSTRTDAYLNSLQYLSENELIYRCICSRKTISETGGIYDNRCRDQALTEQSPSALRLKVSKLPNSFTHIPSTIYFNDIFMGKQLDDIEKTIGDYILRRKDGLFAYQLAVVVDDMFQNISHVIRGSDLLRSTAQQIFLFKLFRAAPPNYGHCPVVLNACGQKLSKQNLAAPLNEKNPTDNLFRALLFLKQQPPLELKNENPDAVIQWAIKHWRRSAIPNIMGVEEINNVLL